jgi:hypothetical protein
VVPGAENLQFRDVQGVSDKIAYLMSIGSNTTDFRIYKTVDGGANWTIEFTNQTVNAFYDCFAFWTPKRGIAHSDSVNGVFPIFAQQMEPHGILSPTICRLRCRGKPRLQQVGPAWRPNDNLKNGFPTRSFRTGVSTSWLIMPEYRRLVISNLVRSRILADFSVNVKGIFNCMYAAVRT